MVSLFSFGASKEISSGTAGLGHRPETMRRAAIGETARILAVLGALATPVSIHGLVSGAPLAFVVTSILLIGAVATLALHRNGQFAHAVSGQLATMMGAGAVLSLGDAAIADFGLALALLGPVLASLIATPDVRRASWWVLGAITLGSVGASWAGVPEAGHPLVSTGMGAAIFAIGAIVVARAASRINFAYEVYDKAQVTAYEYLIEHSRDAVVRFSSEGAVLYASMAAETVFGCQRYEVSAETLGERVHIGDRPAYLTGFADANHGGKSRTIEVRIRRDMAGSGVRMPTFFWCEVSFSAIPDGGAARHEVVAQFRDISARKSSETDMQRARQSAEDASDAKSRFLATIGHELRTPLNAVVGFSEMMVHGIGGELGDTHREYAGLIHQSGRHLLEVVGMLLDMSKIEAGKFEIQPETFVPDQLVDPCFAMVEGLARERRVTLKRDIAYPLPAMVADERACRQILINLLSNAVKFSHPGGVVSVSLKRQGQSLNISVSDRGVGMDASSVERIGEPFFQAQGGTDRRHEGTGLGLSIVKGLVELHGGTLRAVSEIGAGTTMTVLLPLNGPAINVVESGTVTALDRAADSDLTAPWHDAKRKAL